jgi:hypothetical protein
MISLFRRVKYRSKCRNIYHLCVHKTGSQWIRKILSDDRTYRYSGLVSYQYFLTLPGGVDGRRITERAFDVAFPEGTIVTPVYIDRDNFEKIPKPSVSRAFFVARDPRDILVSWYFSMKKSHAKMGKVDSIRESINAMPTDEGFAYAIDEIERQGLFAALRSWADVPGVGPDAIRVRYEDLVGGAQFEMFRNLFDHCDIRMPDKVLRELLNDCAFERLSGGRTQGQSDEASHYRKGVSGDWRNHFTPEIERHFRDVTGDLVVRLGYEW